MAKDAPQLDSRTSDDLVNEARNLIPQFNPEWTNLNDSDPGMTLVKVHAWLTETLLYQVNQLPDKNYDKFVELLGVKPKLATSAQTDIAFKLSKSLKEKTEPLVVNIPLGAKLEVDDPELEQPIVFETTASLPAVNAAIGAVIVPNETNDEYRLVSEYNAKQAELTITAPFFPFLAVGDTAQGMYLGIALRPHQNPDEPKDYIQDRWPEGELNLTVAATDIYDRVTDEAGVERQIQGPYAETSLLAHQRRSPRGQQEAVLWRYFNGGNSDEFFDDAQWTAIPAAGEGRDFTRSGHVTLNMPDGVPLVRFEQLPREVFRAAGGLRQPSNQSELLADLAEGVVLATDITDDQWAAMGIDDAELLQEIKNCCSENSDLATLLSDAGKPLDSLAIRNIAWDKINKDDAYLMPSLATTPMIWLQVKPSSGLFTRRLFNSIHLNTVAASARETFYDQKLGVSNGRPNQTFKLAKTPLLFDLQTDKPDMTVLSAAQDQPEQWHWQNDFYQTDAKSRVFTFDPLTQSIIFGDGIYGAIVPAGETIYIRQMRVGGGVAANVGRFTITKLKRVIENVDSVTNPLAAIGGQDTEAVKQTRLRAGHEIKHRDRAVTADDFVQLTLATPSVPVHSAYAVPLLRVNKVADDDVPEGFHLEYKDDIPGAVTVMFLPMKTTAKPQPSESEIKAVAQHLNQKRLITTELYVVGPRYKDISALQVNLSIGADYDLKAVKDAVQTRLLKFFHPVTGGRQNSGWPFGEDIYLSDIFCQILAVDGVSRAYDLTLAVEGITNSTDRIEVTEQQLIFLSAKVLDIKVDYEY